MHSPYFKLKVCIDYLNGLTHKQITKKYGISRFQIYEYMKVFDKDFVGCLEFYRYIMLELAAKGYDDAAKYLRNSGISILSSFFHGDLKRLGFDFGEAMDALERDVAKREAQQDEENSNKEGQLNDEIRRQINAFTFYQPDREDD